jgi:hypothetical protein
VHTPSPHDVPSQAQQSSELHCASFPAPLHSTHLFNKRK